MIKIEKSFEIVRAVKPFTWSFKVTGCTEDCIMFPEITGQIGLKEEPVIDVEFFVTDEACFTTCTVVLVIDDAEGCHIEYPITFENPCAEFAVGPVTSVEPYTFSVNPTGGSGQYLYTWTWDTDVFELAPLQNNDPNNQSVVLQRTNNPISPGMSTTVRVTVTDETIGCVGTSSTNYTFCTPSAINTAVTPTCDTCSGDYNYPSICLEVDNPCASSTIDWSTLEVISNIPGLEWNLINGTLNCISLHIEASGTSSGNYPNGLVWTVRDSNNFIIQGNVAVTLGECSPLYSIVSSCPSITFNCDNAPGTQCLDLSQCINAIPCDAEEGSGTIDWSTLTFIPNGFQTITTPPHEMESTAGGVATNSVITFNSATKNLCYEVTDANASGSDSITFTVCDTLGNCSANITIIFNIECVDCATAGDVTDCTDCTDPVVTDVLQNSTPGSGSWMYNTLSTISGPSNGTISINTSNGEVTYTANAGFSGSDSYTVQIYTTESECSPVTITVTVDVVCAGTAQSLAVCE